MMIQFSIKFYRIQNPLFFMVCCVTTPPCTPLTETDRERYLSPWRPSKCLESHPHSLLGCPGSFWVPSDPSEVTNRCITQQYTVCHNSTEWTYCLFRALTSLFFKSFVFSHLFSSYLVHWKLKTCPTYRNQHISCAAENWCLIEHRYK